MNQKIEVSVCHKVAPMHGEEKFKVLQEDQPVS